MAIQRFRIGEWVVEPELNTLRKGQKRVRVEPKTMQVLVFLANHPGEVFSRERLIEEVWPDAFVTDGVLWNGISELRKVFADDPKNPTYIETVPRLGYRLVAPVTNLDGRQKADSQGAAAPSVFSSRLVWTAAGLILILATAAWIFWPDLFEPWTRALDFQERDWVLITEFDNRTGEEILDGTLKAALELELVNSPYVDVVPRERVNDTLRLMKVPDDAPVDSDLGREICQRDGAIRALLTGSVKKLGSSYLLSTTIVDPFTGVQLSSTSEQAHDLTEVLPAMGRLCNWLRENLGESLASIRTTNEKLEKATTPSLRALHLFSKGMALGHKRAARHWAQAEPLFRAAIEEDPTFASAHLFLAWAIRNSRNKSFWELTELRAHIQRAVDLADTATLSEKLFITGTHQLSTGAHDQACTTFKALADLNPAHFWGANNAAIVCHKIGRTEEASPYWVRRADLRPRSVQNLYNAAEREAFLEKDWTRARQYVERAQQLLEDPSFDGLVEDEWYGYLRLLPIMGHWQSGDLQLARDMVAREARSLDTLEGVRRDSLIRSLARFQLTLGQLRAAEETSRRRPGDNTDRSRCLAWVAYLRDDRKSLRKHLQRFVGLLGERLRMRNNPFIGLLFVQSGLAPELRQILSETYPRSFWDISVPSWYDVEWSFIPGALAIAENRPGGIPLLQEMAARYRTSDWADKYLAVEILAQALEERGDLIGAAETLEAGSRERGRVTLDAGPFWLRVRQRLARVYRKLGREGEARQVEEELLKLLAYADSDHPILLEIERQQQLDAEPTGISSASN